MAGGIVDVAAIDRDAAAGALDDRAVGADVDRAASGVDLAQPMLHQVEPAGDVGHRRALADVHLDLGAVQRRIAQHGVVGQFGAAQIDRDDVAFHRQPGAGHARDIDLAAGREIDAHEVGLGIHRRQTRCVGHQAFGLDRDVAARRQHLCPCLELDILPVQLDVGLVEGGRAADGGGVGRQRQHFGHAVGPQHQIARAFGDIGAGVAGTHRLVACPQVDRTVEIDRGRGRDQTLLVDGVADHRRVAAADRDLAAGAVFGRAGADRGGRAGAERAGGVVVADLDQQPAQAGAGERGLWRRQIDLAAGGEHHLAIGRAQRAGVRHLRCRQQDQAARGGVELSALAGIALDHDGARLKAECSVGAEHRGRARLQQAADHPRLVELQRTGDQRVDVDGRRLAEHDAVRVVDIDAAVGLQDAVDGAAVQDRAALDLVQQHRRGGGLNDAQLARRADVETLPGRDRAGAGLHDRAGVAAALVIDAADRRLQHRQCVRRQPGHRLGPGPVAAERAGGQQHRDAGPGGQARHAGERAHHGQQAMVRTQGTALAARLRVHFKNSRAHAHACAGRPSASCRRRSARARRRLPASDRAAPSGAARDRCRRAT